VDIVVFGTYTDIPARAFYIAQVFNVTFDDHKNNNDPLYVAPFAELQLFC